MRICHLFALIAFIISMRALLVFAQGTSQSIMQNNASQYYLGSQDQVLMPVNVWGFVGKPGQYMVPYGTDLISLLSYAGGPNENAKIKNVKVVRVPGNSDGNNDNNEVIEVNIKDYTKSALSQANPVLKPGDTIVVKASTVYRINKIFDFAWRIAVIVQAYALIDYYSNR